jgi:group I intron endonuclease
MEIYIYKHTSPSGKCYIGQTTNPKNRWRSSAYKPCPKFYNAIQKYGWCNFTHEIIFTCHDQFEANRKEEYFIREYNSVTDGYNTRDVVEENMRGEKNPMYGKSVTDFMTDEQIAEWKKHLSESNRGEKNGFYGKHHSEETKEKLRLIKLGVSNPLNLSDEQRMALSDRAKAAWTEDRRKAQSEKMRGENNPMHKRGWSEEERERMRGCRSGEKNPCAKAVIIIDTFDGSETYCSHMGMPKEIIGLDKTHIHRYRDTGKLYKGRYLIKGVA